MIVRCGWASVVHKGFMKEAEAGSGRPGQAVLCLTCWQERCWLRVAGRQSPGHAGAPPCILTCPLPYPLPQVTAEKLRLRRKAAVEMQHFTAQAIEELRQRDDGEFLQGWFSFILFLFTHKGGEGGVQRWR